MFTTLKHGIDAVEKLAQALETYAQALEKYAQAIDIRRDLTAGRKQDEQKTATKNEKVRNFQVVCIETGETITSRAKYALYRKIKIGLGGTSTRALKQGKTVKSAKTQLHYKAVKGFE